MSGEGLDYSSQGVRRSLQHLTRRSARHTLHEWSFLIADLRDADNAV
jgi:hypothetical protein